MTIKNDNQSQISACSAVVTNTDSPNSPGVTSGAALFARQPKRKPRKVVELLQSCRICQQLKPLQSFTKSRSNLSGRSTLCYTCKSRDPKVRQAIKRWQENNPDYAKQYREGNKERFKEYARQYRIEEISKRPAKTPCQCGNVDRFRWFKGAWECLACLRLQSKANTWKKHQRSRRRIRIRSRVKSLEKYGEKMVQTYEDLMQSGHSLLIEDWQLVRMILPPDYRHLKRDSIKRIRDMNELSGLPTWNVGWKCSRCTETSFDHRFFDLDHRLPRHKKGSNRKENLQILCPNCHRRKTLCDLWGSGEITPNELVASVPERADAASLNNTPNAGQPALCGGAGTLVPTAQDSVGIS